MLHLVSPDLGIVIHTRTVPEAQYYAESYAPGEGVVSEFFSIREWAGPRAGVVGVIDPGNWNRSLTQWFPRSIVDTAVALLDGGDYAYGNEHEYTGFAAVEASDSTRPTVYTWYSAETELTDDGMIIERSAHLRGFTDRQARMIFERVTGTASGFPKFPHNTRRPRRGKGDPVAVAPVPVPSGVDGADAVPVGLLPVIGPVVAVSVLDSATPDVSAVTVTVIEPGRAVITGAGRTGAAVRNPVKRSGFDVVANGVVIGRAASYKVAGEKFAAHVGVTGVVSVVK